MGDSFNAQVLLDFLGHGVLVVDKSAKIIYANKSAKKLFSSFATIVCYSSYLHEIIPSLAKEKYPLSWEKAGLFELRGQDIVAFASKFADKKGDELSILVIQKLEELEPLYRELIMIKQELEQIFNSSYDEIFTTGADGTALRVSAEACRRLYGVEPEELIGRNVKELEAEGYFRPSVYDIVMRDKKRITVMQT
ncbi:MAG: PAS domain S-box protein, partial [Firmicutes bacterium]|nr:PAS domain S-box protein [Bacillota bacterium]